jgi:hypothetical protein
VTSPASGASCDDGDATTLNDVCSAGICSGVSVCALGCDDGDPCTADSCDAAQGCLAAPVSNVPCDDGNAATLNDTCMNGACVGASLCAALNCDDGNSCTADACDPASGCTSTPTSGVSCNDNDGSTFGDTCTAGVCAGSPLVPVCTTIKRSTGGVVQDSWIHSGQPTTNFGSAAGLKVSSSNFTTRALYQFDLSAIPALAQVVSADVTLRQAATISAQNLEIHRVTAPWTELGVSSVTFANAFDLSILTSFPAVANGAPSNLTFSLTAQAQAWINGSTPNNGFAVLVTAPGPASSLTLSASEDVASNQPALTLCYVLPCGTGCDDGNPCTTDTCNMNLGCQMAPTSGNACNDANPSTLNDTCVAGVCVGLGLCGLGCDDGDPCTADSCDPALGCLTAPSSGAACSDGNAATVNDVCAAGVCAGTPVPQPNGGSCLTNVDCQSGSCTCGYCGTAPSWTSISTTNAPTSRALHAAVWTGSKMIVWGGQSFGACDPLAPSTLNTGGVYDPATGTWTTMSTVNAPPPRARPTAFWMGAPYNKLVVWGGLGGCDQPSATNTGGLYDPETDTWTTMSLVNAPLPRVYQGGLWTGSKLIIWGGKANTHLFQNTGAIWDPATDTWATITTTGAPYYRGNPMIGWTGSEMLVFGGFIPGHFIASDGGIYNPGTDAWRALTLVNAPSPRMMLQAHKAMIDTGSELLGWGGTSDYWTHQPTNTGSRYDIASDSWVPMTNTNAPAARDWHASLWTGKHMLIWGGADITSVGMNSGGVYNPTTDTWCPTVQDATTPKAAWGVTGVWTGNYAPLPNRAIFWGGIQTSCTGNTCNGIYQPGGI